MRTLLFVILATILEATGDAVVRISIHHHTTSTRIALFLAGAVCLTLYGTSLNLAPVEFAEVTGIYIAMLFVMFQVTGYLFFRAIPTLHVALGGVLIIAGGLIVGYWR